MLPVVGFISRVRTSLKLKQNKTVDGRLKRNSRQFCFISVLFHDVRLALGYTEVWQLQQKWRRIARDWLELFDSVRQVADESAGVSYR